MFNAIVRLKVMYTLGTIVMHDGVSQQLGNIHSLSLREISTIPIVCVNTPYLSDWIGTRLDYKFKEANHNVLISLTQCHNKIHAYLIYSDLLQEAPLSQGLRLRSIAIL